MNENSNESSLDSVSKNQNQAPKSDRLVKIAMVAGEASGDILGAGLIASLKSRYPNAEFEGIGGPLMQREGFNSHVPMERLSVMGLFEVLGRIFELIGIRRRLRKHFLSTKPDVFIGIDAPDFNIGLELALRRRGLKTAHYVSPSVWAWRQKRVYKIAKAVDLMLTLFPFEAKFYRAHKIAVRFVGHPLADIIPMRPSREAARSELNIPSDNKVLAILPGSRAGEISRVLDVFISAAQLVRQKEPNLICVIPCVNDERKAQVELMLKESAPALDVRVVLGQSRSVMSAADTVLLASGTATLECMLLKRPMVVAYKLNALTYKIMKRLIKTPFVALPNLLADSSLVPELLQDAATADNIAEKVLERLPVRAGEILEESFSELHSALKLNASEEAAEAVSRLIEGAVDEECVNG
jgi:lipid-A-disaccharide synthase